MKIPDFWLRLRKYDVCGACHKPKYNVKIRSYIVPKVDSKPITSINKLCNDCFNRIKAKTI